mmetsp:Transcript_1201/g.3670  ORF Transcript_1201/g.3670 Transcript_1201/m.3670 type:complete len:170 (-) Transcript_1201:531-1040(-)
MDPESLSQQPLCMAMGCKNPGSLRCKRCKCANYCGRPCQTNHWAEHKQVCTELGKLQRAREEDLDEKRKKYASFSCGPMPTGCGRLLEHATDVADEWSEAGRGPPSLARRRMRCTTPSIVSAFVPHCCPKYCSARPTCRLLGGCSADLEGLLTTVRMPNCSSERDQGTR